MTRVALRLRRSTMGGPLDDAGLLARIQVPRGFRRTTRGTPAGSVGRMGCCRDSRTRAAPAGVRITRLERSARRSLFGGCARRPAGRLGIGQRRGQAGRRGPPGPEVSIARSTKPRSGESTRHPRNRMYWLYPRRPAARATAPASPIHRIITIQSGPKRSSIRSRSPTFACVRAVAPAIACPVPDLVKCRRP